MNGLLVYQNVFLIFLNISVHHAVKYFIQHAPILDKFRESGRIKITSLPFHSVFIVW